jgi:hypothetical protein
MFIELFLGCGNSVVRTREKSFLVASKGSLEYKESTAKKDNVPRRL